MKTRKPNLNFVVIKKAIDIFKEKKWPFADDDDGGDDEDLFEKFCNMLNALTEDEQSLLLTLTESFERFTLKDYPKLCESALYKIDKRLIKYAKTIYLVPLNSPKDIRKGKIKSGGQIAYLAKKILKKHIDSTRQRIVDVSDIYKLFELYSSRRCSLIIFIDDFVGTGSTASETLEEYCKNKVDDDKVIIVSAVALKIGVEAINNIGFSIYYSEVLEKGIQDSKKISDKERAYKIINGIEDRLKISGKFRLGFRQSEALVKMYRTPNNTFPVYWCTEMNSGGTWPALFPR